MVLIFVCKNKRAIYKKMIYVEVILIDEY